MYADMRLTYWHTSFPKPSINDILTSYMYIQVTNYYDLNEEETSHGSAGIYNTDFCTERCFWFLKSGVYVRIIAPHYNIAIRWNISAFIQ